MDDSGGATGAQPGGSVERVRAAAAAAGLSVAIEIMPDSTRTAEDAARACRTGVAQIVKSLLFRRADGAPLLLLVSGANRVDETAVAALVGGSLARMPAREVRAVTGFAIGGVAPIGSVTPLATYIDADLMQFERVWAAAGAPNAVFSVAPEALRRAANADVIVVSGGPATGIDEPPPGGSGT